MYSVFYQVFVGSGNLVRARQVAENALYWRPDDERWWRRLAEISRWQGDPETSLKAWRQVALRSNDPEAWKQVLVLAPLTYSNRLALRANKALILHTSVLHTPFSHMNVNGNGWARVSRQWLIKTHSLNMRRY